MIRRFFVLLVATLAFGAFSACAAVLTAGEMATQRDEADQLVAVIENFESDVGRYPESLEDLVPRYVDMAPTPPLDDSYSYRLVRSDREFELGYSISSDRGCGWLSFFERWECSSGHP